MTYTYRQVDPPLSPVRRILPPAPSRARKTTGSTPFPSSRRIGGREGKSPEDVVADSQGRLAYGLVDGRVFRLDPKTGAEELLVNTQGRPLGLEYYPNNDDLLIICDAHRGLLRYDIKNGNLETLVDNIGGKPLMFCSNAAVESSTGIIWFTQSSQRFPFERYLGAMIEHRGTGRLMKYDPITKIATVILDNLHFANGITLNKNEDAVIFAETDGYSIKKYWTKGNKHGRVEELVTNLPGFPDNFSPLRSGNGHFWVAIPSARMQMLDNLGTSPGWVRKMIWRLPNRFFSFVGGPVWAMAFDEYGDLVADIQQICPHYNPITGVVEANGKLYGASLHDSGLIEIDIDKIKIGPHPIRTKL